MGLPIEDKERSYGRPKPHTPSARKQSLGERGIRGLGRVAKRGAKRVFGKRS